MSRELAAALQAPPQHFILNPNAMFRSRNSPEHPVLTQFLETVYTARTTSDPELLSSCLNLAPDFLLQNASMRSLVAEIRQLPNLKPAVERVLGTEWPGFMDLISAYLGYTTSIDPAMMSDVGLMLAWFENMKKYMGYAKPRLRAVKISLPLSIGLG
jgi:hypothetical protein